jgi:hypothetical protein
MHSLRAEYHWYPESYIRARVEDECASYMWRMPTIEDLWDQWRAPNDA